MPRLAIVLALLAVPALVHAQGAPDTLKKIRDGKSIVIAYRTDALPFSFEENKQPTGYSVELCKRVAASLEQQLKTQPLAVKWVAATSQNRMDLVRKGEAHMECGSTTATLSRMEQVDFSSPIFVDTTGLLVRKSTGAKALGGLAGKKIAVIGGTTNERALQAALKKQLVSATVVQVKNRDEGIAALEAGAVDALSSDKILLATTEQTVFDLAAASLTEAVVTGDDPAAEHWRSEYLYSRAATIYGGSAEIQRNIVARRLLDLGADR